MQAVSSLPVENVRFVGVLRTPDCIAGSYKHCIHGLLVESTNSSSQPLKTLQSRPVVVG